MTSIRVTTTRYSFQVVREAAPAYPAGATLGSPPDAVAIARHVIGSEIAEVLLVLLLDSRHRGRRLSQRWPAAPSTPTASPPEMC